MLSFTITGTYTDLYELSMAQAYVLSGRQNKTACFDYFFRKIPNHGGYVLFAGLEDILTILESLHFTNEDLYFLKEHNFHPTLLEYLKGFRFRGSVYAVPEGEVIFANCPVVRVEGNILETQLIESLILNFLNFESLVATKASRIRYVAGNRLLSDFGLRRAHGPGAILAARAAVVGGFDSTSNAYAAELYNLKPSGTMAHSFVASYDTELEAFRAFAKACPNECVFLVDTYNTLSSGVPNAIVVAKEMEKEGKRARGIRLDSGHLAYLAKASRQMLNEAGLPYLKIIASNQLDEYVIKNLLEQKAPIDVFGVGTNLVTGKPDAALDGVYKLAMAAGKPRLKLSESAEKITLPGIKQVLRVLDACGRFYGADAVLLQAEDGKTDMIYQPFNPGKSLRIAAYPQEPLLNLVMKNGKRVNSSPSLTSIAAYAQHRLSCLPEEYKRFENPSQYIVGISRKLMTLREKIKNRYKSTEPLTATNS